MGKNKLITVLVLLSAVIVGGLFFSVERDQADESPKETIVTKTIEKVIPKEESKVILPVAFASEAPEGKWVQPWANACEEATILMAEKFYTGATSISVDTAKTYLEFLFDKEIMLFGTNRNADAFQIAEVIEKYADFKGRIVRNPTLEDLKKEIREGRPIISLHRGFDLHNDNIGFSPIKSSYHTIVLVGFDDDKKIFYAHDPGDEFDGENHVYSYDTIMNSMHDYNSRDDKADGEPTVIFTSSK